MSLDGTTATVTHEGFTVTSTDSEAQIRQALGAPVAVVVETTDIPDDTPIETPVEPATEPKPAVATLDRDPETGKFTKKDWQKRVDKLTWQREEEKRRADALHAELETLRQPKPVKEPEPKPAEPSTTFPTWEQWSAKHDGQGYEDYLDERADFRAEQKVNAALSAEKTERQKERDAENARSAERQAQTTLEKLDTLGRKAHQDFRDSLESLVTARLPFSPTVAGIIAEELDGDAPLGHELAYYLATHHDDLRRLNSYANPLTAAREVQKLLSQLGAASQGSASEPLVSQAKPPTKPVGSGPSAAPESDPGDDEPVEAFIKRANAADRKAGRLR